MNGYRSIMMKIFNKLVINKTEFKAKIQNNTILSPVLNDFGGSF